MAVETAARARRKPGSGSIFQLGDEWVGEYRSRDQATGRVVKRRLFRESRSAVEVALSRTLKGRPMTPVAPPPRVRIEPRSTAVDVVEHVLRDAGRLGWDLPFTARVILAATSPIRIRFGIYGPCAYCGDWTASSVDHIVPRSRGGGDNPANLASACWPCNQRKGALTADEFRRA